MEFLGIMLLTSLGGFILYAIQSAAVRAPGASLQSKFAALQSKNGGQIAGVSYSDIVAACGAPSAISSVGNGKVLKQWQATGYHLALLFDENDICAGVSSEISV
jgi:hypothetical protein